MKREIREIPPGKEEKSFLKFLSMFIKEQSVVQKYFKISIELFYFSPLDRLKLAI